jgi:hypothetical protein
VRAGGGDEGRCKRHLGWRAQPKRTRGSPPPARSAPPRVRTGGGRHAGLRRDVTAVRHRRLAPDHVRPLVARALVVLAQHLDRAAVGLKAGRAHLVVPRAELRDEDVLGVGELVAQQRQHAVVGDLARVGGWGGGGWGVGRGERGWRVGHARRLAAPRAPAQRAAACPHRVLPFPPAHHCPPASAPPDLGVVDEAGAHHDVHEADARVAHEVDALGLPWHHRQRVDLRHDLGVGADLAVTAVVEVEQEALQRREQLLLVGVTGGQEGRGTRAERAGGA